MTNRRKPAQWKDIPASSELAALVRCEAEFVWERNTGRIGADPVRQARAKIGEAVHRQSQLDMERHHNQGRLAAAARSSRGSPAPRPAPAPASPPLSMGGVQHPVGQAPSAPVPTSTGRGPDRRCFLATSLYGADAPQTVKLRAFRDRHLVPYGPGRVAVSLYYRASPHVVDALASRPALRAGVRSLLDRLVRTIA